MDPHNNSSSHYWHYHYPRPDPRPGSSLDHAGSEDESPPHPSVHYPRFSKGDGHSRSRRLYQHDGQGGIHRTVHPVVISRSTSLGRPPQPRLPASTSTPPDAPQRTPVHARFRGGPRAPTPLRSRQPQQMVDGLNLATLLPDVALPSSPLPTLAG